MVTASAIAITRGSCRCGLAKRVVSGATASQPTNDSIRVVAARPTGGQPWGANGVQLPVLADPADPATATATSATSRPTRTSWAPADTRSPATASASTASSSAAAIAALAARPPPVSSVT